MFLGANIDAGKEAEKIGIARNRSVTYENDEHGIALNYEAVGSAVKKWLKVEVAVQNLTMIGLMRLLNIISNKVEKPKVGKVGVQSWEVQSGKVGKWGIERGSFIGHVVW